MIVDPRWYECYIAALTGVSSAHRGEAGMAPKIAAQAKNIADEAYEGLLEHEAELAAEKLKEVKKGQVWRFKESGPIRVVAAVEGDVVRMRPIDGERDLVPFSAKKILESKDCFLVGQEPKEVDAAAVTAPEGEQSQSS